ncbi:MAG: MFS transporter [Anaerolineae bacterium]|nr:MFS transporter [Anaerolineae bacterium]
MATNIPEEDVEKPSSAQGHDPYIALRFRDFRLLIIARFITSLGNQMLTFAIGWDLWLRTQNEFLLGLVGLVQVIPIILLALPAGALADRYNRKRIVMVTQSLLATCSLGLALISLLHGPIWAVFVCLFGVGLARAFNDPASSTLLPQTVPPEVFTSAATWGSSSWQMAAIVGPALAGVVVAVFNNVTGIYFFDAFAGATFLVLIALIKGRQLALSKEPITFHSLMEGLYFIRNTRVLLAAITLDLFAVLFGGAVTLLPVFATDILKVGAEGLGLLRAAPSIGAMLMALLLAHLPPFKHAGRTLLLVVAGFGLATIVFGLSRLFPLSLLMLFILGALDNVSVVIRGTLMLTRTPDEMRGRTSAVNSIFISASNELGGFESGLTGAWFGAAPAVIIGGIGTLLVVLGVAHFWPEMSALRTLDPPAETTGL